MKSTRKTTEWHVYPVSYEPFGDYADVFYSEQEAIAFALTLPVKPDVKRIETETVVTQTITQVPLP